VAIDPDLLARLPAFADVGDAARAPVAAAAEVVRAPAGTTLFREGEPGEDVYFLLEGRVGLSLRLPGRAEMMVLSLGAGELTGWSGILPHERVATARVVEDAVLVRIPGRALLDACEADHELGYRVMKQLFTELTRRLHETRLQMIDAFGEAGG